MSTTSHVDTSTLPAPDPATRFTPPPRLRPLPVRHALDHLHVTPWRLGVVIGFGLLAALVAYGGFTGVAATLLITTAAIVLLADSRVLTWERALWAGIAIALGVLPLVRASGWVWLTSVGAASVCLVALARIRLAGSAFDATWRQITGTIAQTGASAFWSAAWVVRAWRVLTKPATRTWQRPALRAVVVAAPLVAVVWLLLASADAVFRNVISLHLNVPVIATTVVGFAIGVVGLIALLGAGLVHPQRATPQSVTLGLTEQLSALIGLCVVLAVFVAVQISVAFGNTLGSLSAQGITVADYARSGWFQMLTVVGIIVVVLIAFHALAPESVRVVGSRAFVAYRLVVTLLLLLTCGLLFSATHRLALYDAAFGLTMLRLACWFGAVWIGCVLILLLALTWNVRPNRQWLPGMLLLTAAMTTFAWGVSNPVAVVVTHDVGRSDADIAYLSSLGPDAIGPLLTSTTTSNTVATDITTTVCASPAPVNTVRQFNVAIEVARGAWMTYCGH